MRGAPVVLLVAAAFAGCRPVLLASAQLSLAFGL